jgi:Zn-dependent protease with chaperone function
MTTESPESSTVASPARTQPQMEEVDAGAASRSTGGVARKVKTVRARPGGLADEGLGARGVAEAVAATSRTLTPEEILAAFGARIQPVRPSAVYRLSVVIVTIAMVLLPSIYIGLIGLIVAALYYHAVYDIAIFQHVGKGSGASKGAILIYLGPLIAGAMVVAFMLKPLFAKPAQRETVHVLESDAEALLHAFVAKICDSVGAPRPSRIEADSEVNASARREGFLLGIFGNTLVLRIGLPLVAGLNLRQFAGVLAHEFGHFSQGAGMRLAVVIMSINSWFARVVYERDSWDEGLAQWSTSGGTEVMILVGLIRLSIWLTRRILWVLMWVGHLVTVSLRRQMEYDADRYEARMVGAGRFLARRWNEFG